MVLIPFFLCPSLWFYTWDNRLCLPRGHLVGFLQVHQGASKQPPLKVLTGPWISTLQMQITASEGWAVLQGLGAQLPAEKGCMYKCYPSVELLRNSSVQIRLSCFLLSAALKYEFYFSHIGERERN